MRVFVDDEVWINAGGSPCLPIQQFPIVHSPASSGERKPYLFPNARQALSGFIPPVQVASANEAAATQTPVCKHCAKSQPSCSPSNTPAQKASPAPAVPAINLSGSLTDACQASSPLRVRPKPPSGK